MKASTKKLLSMLVVMAMVFSMVPTFTLPAAAVETEAASTTVTPGQANLPEGIQDKIDKGNAIQTGSETALANNYCPVCETTVEWKAVTSKPSDDATTNEETKHLHYVISGNLTNANYNFNALTGTNITLCLLLDNATVTLNGRFRIAGTNNTLNIMGTGSITSDGTKCEDLGLFTMNGTNPTLNLYGGNFTYTGASVSSGTAPVRATINAVDATTPNVNIYGSAAIGKETVDTTVANYNVYVASGTINMYGGTIRNGVTGAYAYSGNVGVAGGTTFNMYAGTIEGGQYLAGTDASGNTLSSPASVGGNILVGCYTKINGSYTNAAANFNMYGGTVTGGKSYNGGNGGGNICTLNSGTVMQLLGGTIKDGWARAYGGNVQHQQGTATIGGTVLITNGYAQNYGGGNLEVSAGRTLTMSGGFIQGGTRAAVDGSDKNATTGGGVYVRGTFKMTGGEIDGCKVSGNGGNIYAAAGATVTIGENAVIKNGLSTTAANGGGGGNVYLAASTTAGSTMTTEGTITGGTVNGGSEDSQSAGGNICVVASGAIQSTLTVNGGTIADGTVTYNTKGSAFGGNIRAYNCKVVINDGLIYNGNAGSKYAGSVGVMGGTSTSANTNCTLEINGGIIVGGVSGCQQKTDTETTNSAGDTTYTHTCSIKLTGSPKILRSYKVSDTVTSTAVGGYGLNVSNNYPLDISGLNSDAEIWVSGNTLNMVFTKAYDGTADLLSCFHHTNSTTRAVGLTDDSQQLQVIEYEEPVQTPVVGTFNPWDCDDMAYCPVCYENGTNTEPVKWTAYNGEYYSEATVLTDTTNSNAHFHLYLADNFTMEAGKSFLISYRTVCFNLNGHDITAVEGSKYAFSCSRTLNLMDTEGGAVVTGYQNANNTGATLHANGGNASSTYNIYGGTYTKLASDTASSIVRIGENGGTINLYDGAVIDATGKSVSTNAVGCAVTLVGNTDKNAVFNMEGGEIKGGNAVQAGAVMVGTTNYDCAIFNLKGGKISGGTVDHQKDADGNVVMNTAGTGPKGAGAGGNFSVQYGGTLNISGGTLCNGTVIPNDSGSSWGGNIRAYNGNVNISGGLIYGGTGGKQLAGANVSCYSDATGREAGRGMLTISGGTIVGDVAVTSGAADVLTLSDAPVIVTSMEIDGETVNAVSGGLTIHSGNYADISALSADADIALSASVNVVITEAHENAANVVSCFKHVNDAYTVELQSDNTLKVVEKPVAVPEVGVFAPWDFEGMAYCPVCLANGTHTEPVEWTVLGNTAVVGATGHYYLNTNISDGSVGGNTGFIAPAYHDVACINLNGKDLTVTDGMVFWGANGTLNVMDTAEEQGTVTGYRTSTGGAVFQLNGSKASATINIYGGIFKKSADSDVDTSIAGIGGNGGTINMYGGTIDGSEATNTTYPTAVYLVATGGGEHSGKAIFNMHGGEIKGGTSSGNGATIAIGYINRNEGSTNYDSETATKAGQSEFNLYDGTISGGVANGAIGGGNILVVGNTMNIYGGTVTGGTAAKNDNGVGGGNIAVDRYKTYDGTYVGGTLNMYGGTIENGVAGTDLETNKKANAGNVLVNTGCTLNMSGNAKIIGGAAGNQAGNIRVWKGDLNMSGNAEISGGTAYGANTHNVWLVCSDMTMTDNAVVYGTGTAGGNAIMVAAYGEAGKNNTVISTLTLSGNATVKNKEGTSNNSISLAWTLTNNADATDDAISKLFVTNDWTGEAYFIGYRNDGVADGKTSSTLATCQKGETLPEYMVVCGKLDEDGTFTEGGSFSGKLYYTGPLGTIAADGKVSIGAASIVGAESESWYLSDQAALDAYYANGSFAKGEYLLVSGNVSLTMAGDVYIEGRGYGVTVDGTGTLYALDRANDDYVGYGSWYVEGEVTIADEATNPVNGNRYITILDGGRYTAHRVEMKLTHVTLRTTEAGIYYKAEIKCDDTLAKRVNGYGVVLSRQNMPGKDFLEESNGDINAFTMYESLVPNAETHTVKTTSGALFNIVKDPNKVLDEGEKKREASENDDYIDDKVYANLYLSVDRLDTGILDDCKYFVSDNDNANTTNGIAYSLLDVVSAINTNWTSYSEDQQTKVKECVETWATWLTDEKVAELAPQLGNILG